MSSPVTTSSIKCLRCSEYDLQCTIAKDSRVLRGQSKCLCNHCDAAGLVSCFFPPSTRLVNPRCNSACTSCRQHHRVCRFDKESDAQCTYCSKCCIPCIFKMNGKLIFVDSIIMYWFHILIICFVAQGLRTDITRKRKLNSRVSDNPPKAPPTSAALYAANISPPNWIGVFVSGDPLKLTSRRTQAASIAYMCPKYLNSAYAPNIIRFSNVCRRRMKLVNVLIDLHIPAEFVSKQEEYAGLYNKDVVIVCDGGIDHDVPIRPHPTR